MIAESELTLADLVGILRRSWKAITVLALAFGALAAVLAFALPPIYRGETVLSPAVAESGGTSALSRLAQQFAPIAGLAGITGGMDATGGLAGVEVRLATLRSRRLTEEFIRDKNLLPVLFEKHWDASRKKWKEDGAERPTMYEAVKFFDEKVRTVSEDRRTGLVTLWIDWRDPALAADWSNGLVSRANEFMRRRAIEEAQRSISFLEEELRKTSVVERQQIIYRLIESKTGEIMVASARKEYAFVVVDPAVQPERDHFVKPRRGMIIVIGLILGIVAGVAYGSVRWARRLPSEAPGRGSNAAARDVG